MKNKRVAVMGLVCSMAVGALAIDLASWDFTGPDGSSISNAVDSINGYTFPDTDGLFLTNDMLMAVQSVSNFYSDVILNVPVSVKIRAEWDILPSVLHNGNLVFGFMAADKNITDFRFDCGDDGKLRLACYHQKPTGVEYSWEYVQWLGGKPYTSENIHMIMEYDPASGAIDLAWSGAFNGSKQYAGPTNQTVTALELSGTLPKYLDTDYAIMDNLFVEQVGAPTGVYIAQQDGADVMETNTLYTLESLDVTNGDYVVFLVASADGESPTEGAVSFDGSASWGTVFYQKADTGSGATSHLWYTPVTAPGTVEITISNPDLKAYTLGAYVVRSATGGIQLIDVAGNAGTDLNSLSNVYTLPSAGATGICFEACSTYQNAIAQNTKTIVDYNQWSQRLSTHSNFSGSDALTNTWNFAASVQASVLGIVLAPVPSGNDPQKQYNDWTAEYPNLSDPAMDVDADGDGLDNLVEYAFGGDPSDAASVGNVPEKWRVENGGTNYIQYIYYERIDAATRGLESVLETATDLVTSDWVDASGFEVGRGSSGIDGFSAVTNLVPEDVADKFIRLLIQFTP